jgi:hypothetical protein
LLHVRLSHVILPLSSWNRWLPNCMLRTAGRLFDVTCEIDQPRTASTRACSSQDSHIRISSSWVPVLGCRRSSDAAVQHDAAGCSGDVSRWVGHCYIGETLDSTSNCHDRVWFRRDRRGATSVFGVDMRPRTS